MKESRLVGRFGEGLGLLLRRLSIGLAMSSTVMGVSTAIWSTSAAAKSDAAESSTDGSAMSSWSVRAIRGVRTMGSISRSNMADAE